MTFDDRAGADDIRARVRALEARLSPAVKPLAAVAFNLRWCWARDGRGVFEAVDPHGFALSGDNPVLMLHQLSSSAMEAVEANAALVARIRALADEIAADLARPARATPGIDGPIAYLCAEFGIHRSLSIYSGGLGILAGDVLKEASDRAVPFVGVGLLYRQGYFHQRLDLSGWQHEYWLAKIPEQLPMALVSGPGGRPLQLSVTLCGHEVAFRVWRVDVGRVPLFLLDAELSENDPVDRWITARLYEGNRTLRLAQYGLLGIGGVRTLRALGIEPQVFHLNEGHPALAALELAAAEVGRGARIDDAIAAARQRIVFTTHTPVPAGNETYGRDEMLGVFTGLPERLGIDADRFLALFRTRPDDGGEPPGMTALALRVSRRANGVSRLHGSVARRLWAHAFPGLSVDDVPIGHVTNGVHLPTFMARPIRELLDRHLGDGWTDRAADPATWASVRTIPAGELWAARCAARAELVEYVRERSEQDRLRRGETIDYVRAAARAFDPGAITFGFARRLATYKRLFLLTYYPERALSILGGDPPIQVLIAGKAHPMDDHGKGSVQRIFNLKSAPRVAERVAFLEDYDLGVGQKLVSGCDVWVNLPRPPLEASGTSGMKSVMNGGLQLSVLDGWWAEAFDGQNGWAIPGDVDPSEGAKDARDAATFYDLVQNEIVPLFHKRDENGVPVAWCDKVKHSFATLAPQFSATRMLEQYVREIYPASENR